MTEPVLHHYPVSPFAEKVRAMLGFKGLAWNSVQIPLVLPKPDVVALTGGYRKTPILQVGADIYCDTMLIARVLDRMLAQFPKTQKFIERIVALGHGKVTEIASGEALQIAKSSKPELVKGAVALETDGIALGQQATVMPVDSGFDPVTGELVNASADEIVLRRTDPRAGTVQVHFPRFGYQLNKPA